MHCGVTVMHCWPPLSARGKIVCTDRGRIYSIKQTRQFQHWHTLEYFASAKEHKIASVNDSKSGHTTKRVSVNVLIRTFRNRFSLPNVIGDVFQEV